MTSVCVVQLMVGVDDIVLVVTVVVVNDISVCCAVDGGGGRGMRSELRAHDS